MRNVATLPLLLKQLKLPTFQQHFEHHAQQAEASSWSYPAYLSALAELELSERHTKRLKRYAQESKLPSGKSLDAFDFSMAPSVNAAQITALSEQTDWVRQARNVILFGASGVGKTHLACAIGQAVLSDGIRVLFSPACALVQRLQQAHAQYKLNDFIARLSRYPLLILDDIGYVKKTEAETSVLFELIAQRYETGSLIITANQPFSEWDQIFPDSMMAVAAIDRLVHHATIIQIEEESFRKKQAQLENKKNQLEVGT